MTGYSKITEAFNSANLAKQLECVASNDRAKGRIILRLVHENLQLKRDIAEQAGEIRLLFDIICEPDPPRWHKYGMAFAAGMLAMAIFASVWVSL